MGQIDPVWTFVVWPDTSGCATTIVGAAYAYPHLIRDRASCAGERLAPIRKLNCTQMSHKSSVIKYMRKQYLYCINEIVKNNRKDREGKNTEQKIFLEVHGGVDKKKKEKT